MGSRVGLNGLKNVNRIQKKTFEFLREMKVSKQLVRGYIFFFFLNDSNFSEIVYVI